MAKKKRVAGRKPRRITTDDQKPPWSDLPFEILEMIKKRLFFIDQVNFRAVCKSWSCIERIPPLQQMPWLLVFDDDEMNSIINLVDSNDKKTYTIDGNAIKDKLKITYFNAMVVHESKYGWLLVSNHNKHYHNLTLMLYCPFFDDEKYNFIESPSLNKEFSYATFTSNPLDEDCEIITLNVNYSDNDLLINTYRCGESEWISRIFKCKFEPWDVKSWRYVEGNFYYSTRDGATGRFDLGLEEWSVLPLLPPTMRGLSTLPHHIVNSSDGVLFHILECNLKPRHDIWHYRSHIHRLDLSSMIWEGLDSVGDCVLFIGEGYNSVLNTSGLELNRERISDKIYWCSNNVLKYCSVDDYTAKVKSGKPRKLDCSRHYGPIAKKRCRKMLIDPPPR